MKVEKRLRKIYFHLIQNFKNNEKKNYFRPLLSLDQANKNLTRLVQDTKNCGHGILTKHNLQEF